MSGPAPNFADLDTDYEGNSSFNANETVFDYIAEQVSSVNFYYTPFLVALGTIGNLVSVFVFYNSKLQVQSTSRYLTALALSDTVFLFQLLPPWLNAVQWTGIFHRHGFCQIFVYISYVSCCLSAWLVVAFTVERFVAVLYPLQRNAVCTIKRARHIIFSLTTAALLLNLPVLKFAIPTKNDCNIDFEYLDYAEKFNLVDTVVAFTAPLLVIVVLNTWIMIGVCRLERTRHQLMKTETPAQDGIDSRSSRLQACHRSQQRVTRMLLIVSSVFVILNLPAYTMRILAYAYDMTPDENSDMRWAAIQQVALMFFNTNFGINFILYCLSGQNFRRALRNTIPMIKQRWRRAVAIRRAASFRPARASSISTSFVSNCTEATVNCPPTVLPAPAPGSKRHRPEPVITRWTFDNSRQRQKAALAHLSHTHPQGIHSHTYAQIHNNPHTRAQIHTNSHTRAQIHTNTHTRAQIHTNSHTRAQIHAHPQALGHSHGVAYGHVPGVRNEGLVLNHGPINGLYNRHAPARALMHSSLHQSPAIVSESFEMQLYNECESNI